MCGYREFELLSNDVFDEIFRIGLNCREKKGREGEEEQEGDDAFNIMQIKAEHKSHTFISPSPHLIYELSYISSSKLYYTPLVISVRN